MPILRLDCFSALCLLLYFAANHGLNPQTFGSQNVSMKYSDIKSIPSLLGTASNREIGEENKDFGIIITKINKSGSKGMHNVEYIESSDPEEKHDFFQYSEGFEDGEDIKTFKNQEYEENPLSTNLAAFGKKINIKDSGTTLPVFLNEPQNSFIVKNRPVSLKCKAAYTLQVHFKCSGSSQPPPSVHESHVDPHSGVHMEEVTATVHRDLVDEYFGKGPFQCECHAWSSRGVTKSQAATINVAYIRKQFVLSPTSLRVELGSYAELQCKSPNGIPTPTISWHKNHFPIKDMEGAEILANGSLVLHEVSLQDMANYTCYAENIAGKRISDSAVLIVYVNGGWSSWSSWKDCKCFGKLSQGRKRTRSCNNPLPLNGGLACNGPQVQKSSDCLNCPEDVHIVNSDSIEAFGAGRWSSWGEWSSCSADCIQVRRRKCIIHSMEDTLLENADIQSLNKGFTKSMCSGKDFQTVECRGELCLIGKNDSDWALYLSLAFIAAICLAFCFAIMCCAKRGLTSSPEYNIARTVFESKYVANNEKKIINRNFAMDGNVNYDYANPDHTSISGELAISEHHYDIPNLSANYTNPIDGLSVGYINDTSDTSTSTSDSVNYNFTRKECLSVSKCSGKISSIKDVFNETGGCLKLYDGKVMVYIPEFALGNYDKKNVSLAVLGEEFSRINIKSYDSMLIISTIVSCYPLNFSFLKPCILKIPHCLTDPSLWNISVYSSEAGNNDINVKWETITKVGISTNTSKFFIKIDKLFAYIMTEKMGRFAILAQPNPNMKNLSIEMKLLAFGQVAPNCSAGSVRVYIVKDFPNSREICSKIESQLGGTFLGESRTFSFYLNECDLNIRIQPTGGWESQSHLQEQVIPYNHILSNNSILHCEFCLKKEESNLIKISLIMDFSQYKNAYNNLNTFVVPQSSNNSPTGIDNEKQIISFANRGHLINKVCTESIIPRKIKDILCASLDPLRTDENDWRSFSTKLNLLEYIEYGLSRPNPTENIINLWECRNSQNNLHDLKRILKEIHRDDIVDLIERNSDPIWL